MLLISTLEEYLKVKEVVYLAVFYKQVILTRGIVFQKLFVSSNFLTFES